MGFIGKDDSGDPNYYDTTASISNSGTYQFTNETPATGASITIPMIFNCGHCPRRFAAEQDYEFHIMWHMMETIITEVRMLKPMKKKWWGKLKDIEK